MKNQHTSILAAILVIFTIIGGFAVLLSPQNSNAVLPTLAQFPTSTSQAENANSSFEADVESQAVLSHAEENKIEAAEALETYPPNIAIPTENPIIFEATEEIAQNIANSERSVSQTVTVSQIMTDLTETGNETQVPVLSEETPEAASVANDAGIDSVAFASIDSFPTDVPTGKAHVHPQIEAEIRQNGTAEVLISLRIPANFHGNRQQKQNSIVALENRVIQAQETANFELYNQLDNVPVIHARINQNALNGLMNNPNVAAITPNFGGNFDLADARVAIGGDVAMANYGLTGNGVTVAILDTGVDTDHPALADSIIAQRCYTDGLCGGGTSVSNSAEDDSGHGTHVTGIVTSPAGFAPNADVVMVRVGSFYQTPELRLSDTLLGLDWLITKISTGALHVDVINMSFSFVDLSGVCDSWSGYTDFFDLLDILVTDYNVVAFAASGNNGFTDYIGLPACYSNVISVGATYDGGSIPYDEQQTCTDRPYNVNTITCYSNTTNWLDIVTTGSSIYSTYLNGGYASLSGTSMASPAAAGVAALMREADPLLSASNIRQIMRDTGVPAYNPTDGVYVPRIDVWNAIYAIASVTPAGGCSPNQQIRRVSVTMNGKNANGSSYSPSISANGRFVLFESYANNLLPTDTNGLRDAFVYDLQTCRIQRVSTSTDGAQANIGGQVNNVTDYQGISADGRYVTFANASTNLVIGDSNNQPDIFLHDRQLAYTTPISVASDNSQSNNESYSPHISANGQFIVFMSTASNLVVNDTNNADDIFLRNLSSNVTSLVSASSGGTQSSVYPKIAALSADGQYILFSSAANNLIANDNNNASDVFVRNQSTGVVERDSVNSSGEEANADSTALDISGDGRYVLFKSSASNLDPNDTNAVVDVFLHDRQTGETSLVLLADNPSQSSVISSGNVSMSDDTRYIAFASSDSHVVPNDTNGSQDVFVHDRVTGRSVRVSVSASNVQGIAASSYPEISSDGRYVVFRSNAANLVSGDSNGAQDIFVVDTSYLFPPPFIYTGANLSATATSSTQIVLNWDDIPTDESGYFVERSTDGNSWSQIATVPANSTSYADNSADCNLYVTYQYRIRAYRNNADASTTYSAYSNIAVTNNLACDPPATIVLISPTDMNSFPRSSSVLFTWEADAHATDYYLEYWGGTSADVISSGWISSTSWNPGALKAGVYHWRVKGRDIALEGAWSSPWEFTAILAAPSNLQATPSTNSISLSWIASSDAPSNIAGYHLYHDGVLLTNIAANATTYVHEGLLCDDAQSYYLTAFEVPDFESTATSTVNTSTTSCPPPETGTNLNVAINGNDALLTWSLNYNEPSTTHIERSIDGGSWIEITTVSSDVMNYLDTALACETNIAYRVYVRRNRIGPDSAYSDEASAFTRPCPPNTLLTSSNDKSQIQLSWVDASSSETGFYVEGSNSGAGSWQLLSALDANSTVYTLTGLTCSTTRYFRVKAFRNSDNLYSEDSEVVSGTSQACPPLSAANPVSLVNSTSASVNISIEAATTSDILNIRIQRSTNSTNWNEVAILPATGGIWTDTSVQCGTSYYYRTVNYRPEDTSFSSPSSAVMISTDPCLVIVASRVGIYTNGIWQFSNSLAGGASSSQVAFGSSEAGWQAITGDWNGDGIDGIGLYKDGLFMLHDTVDWSANFGPLETGWQAVAGDWDGDGIDGIGLYKDGIFMLKNIANSGSTDYQFNFGGSNIAWQAIAGDWNGNGSDTVGLYSNGQWQLSYSHTSNPGITNLNFGTAEAGWIAIVGDWNGDGIDTPGLFKDGIWKLRNSNTSGAPDYNFNFGALQSGGLPFSIGTNAIP